MDLNLVKQDTEQITKWDDKLFFLTIPHIRVNFDYQMKTSYSSQNQDENQEDEDSDDNYEEDEQTNNQQSENSSAVLKKSAQNQLQNSNYDLFKKRYDEIQAKGQINQGDIEKLQKFNSFGQIIPECNSKRRISLEDLQEQELFGKTIKPSKKQIINSDKMCSNPELPSQKNVPSFKDVNTTPAQNSTLYNNIGSQMSGFTPSINTKIPSQQSNYVHYSKKKTRKKDMSSSKNQLQSRLSEQNIAPIPSLPKIQQISNNYINSNQQQQNMNQSQGTTILNPSTYQTNTKGYDQYTRESAAQENLNPFENQLDRQKDYKIYFPNYNVEKVLQAIRKKLIQSQKINRMKKYQDDHVFTKKRQKSSIADTYCISAKSPKLMALMNQIKNNKLLSNSNADLIKC